MLQYEDMQREVEQFDEKKEQYAGFVGGDPVRNALHYPMVIGSLGDVTERRILDVGCGDGLFDRALAFRGAKVTGYDKASNLITIAKREEERRRDGIDYVEADATTFVADKPFDEAVSVMVLPYAPDEAALTQFFASTYRALNEGGRFHSVIFNPDFQAFNEVVANRRFVKLDDLNVEVQFLKPNTLDVDFTAILHQFSREEYEAAAKSGGFDSVDWRPLQPTTESLEKLGQQFWRGAIDTQPYALVVARRAPNH